MRFALVQQGIGNAVAHLSKIIQVNNLQVIESERSISWKGRDAGILKNVYYPLEYQHLLDRHQFSLLLSDGSFFQFYYGFSESDELISARLAYYPKPMSTGDSTNAIWDAAEDASDRDDDFLYEHLLNWAELMEVSGKNPSNTSHVRFDFDRQVVSHSQSHLQFSGVHEFRVPAGFYPQPLAFVQLCETLIVGLQPLAHDALGFERNNHLVLDAPLQLIGLSCTLGK